ncbi:MAG TPA: HAD-IIIA family hydrolase [Bryobacteraceae bacterium]|nr:HAD-IIIA family hydrolase [Bryobacteraceae bacterium]
MNKPPGARRAVFLDRDGTLNVEINQVLIPDRVTLIEGAGEAVRAINEAGLLAILITNQAVIARGYCDEKDLEQVHARLRELLARDGGHLDGIYYCPHHPDYTGACGCRKPESGLIRRAQTDFEIDVTRSWVVGDSVKDVRLARTVGASSALVRTGKAGSDLGPDDHPDRVFHTVLDAAEFITEGVLTR